MYSAVSGLPEAVKNPDVHISGLLKVAPRHLNVLTMPQSDMGESVRVKAGLIRDDGDVGNAASSSNEPAGAGWLVNQPPNSGWGPPEGGLAAGWGAPAGEACEANSFVSGREVRPVYGGNVFCDRVCGFWGLCADAAYSEAEIRTLALSAISGRFKKARTLRPISTLVAEFVLFAIGAEPPMPFGGLEALAAITERFSMLAERGLRPPSRLDILRRFLTRRRALIFL